MICSLILASKFYCETEDVVINSDIARLLAGSKNATVNKLNEMEKTFASLIDFNLFVSTEEYNKEAGKLNTAISENRLEEMKQQQKAKVMKKKTRYHRAVVSYLSPRTRVSFCQSFNSLNKFEKL